MFQLLLPFAEYCQPCAVTVEPLAVTVGAVRLNALPAQTAAGALMVVRVGLLFTVMVMLPVFVHPLALAVTVYVVVADGLTVTLAPLPAPLFHDKDDALEVAVSVALLPLQMVLLVALEVTLLRVGTVVTVLLSVNVHPL